jgi:hypothetical protein
MALGFAHALDIGRERRSNLWHIAGRTLEKRSQAFPADLKRFKGFASLPIRSKAPAAPPPNEVVTPDKRDERARARAWLAVCQVQCGPTAGLGRSPRTEPPAGMDGAPQAPRVVSCRMEAAMAAAVGDLPVVHEAREAAPIFRLSRSVGQVAARRPWASHASNSKSALSPARPRMSSMCHRAPSTAARAFSRTRPGVVVGQRVF